MNVMGTLIKREFWENRSLVIAPLVIAGLMVLSSVWSEAMIAPAKGAAIAKPSAMTHRKASNCAKDPEIAARPAPAVYKVSPVLKITRRPRRSPTLP